MKCSEFRELIIEKRENNEKLEDDKWKIFTHNFFGGVPWTDNTMPVLIS
jgi:hypothetical protein